MKIRRSVGRKGPVDSFSHTASSRNGLNMEAMKAFFGKDSPENSKMWGEDPEIQITTNAVRTLTKIGDSNSHRNFIKIPLGVDEDNILVIPMIDRGSIAPGKLDEGKFETPMIYNVTTKSASAADNIKPFGKPTLIDHTQSQDRKKTYLFNHGSTRVKVYDEKGSQVEDFDFSKFDKGFSGISALKFTPGGDYAVLRKKTNDKSTGILAKLDKKTREPLWTKELGDSYTGTMDVDDEGNVAVSAGILKEDKPRVHVFDKDGNKKQEIRFKRGAAEVKFAEKGKLLISRQYGDMKWDLQAIDINKEQPSGLMSLFKDESLWRLKGRFSHLQLSDDGKALYAVDPKFSSEQKNILHKINTKSGEIEWSKSSDNEFIDMRLVDDKIYLLSAYHYKAPRTPPPGCPAVGDWVNVSVYNSHGTKTWGDHHNGRMDKNRKGRSNCITPKGEMVFGAPDGEICHVRPLKKRHESCESVLDDLKKTRAGVFAKTILDKASRKNNKNNQVLDRERYVEIGGVKLDKRSWRLGHRIGEKQND